MGIVLNLSQEETETILQLIGQQPTSTGLFPLAMKIKQQAEASIAAMTAAAEASEETAEEAKEEAKESA